MNDDVRNLGPESETETADGPNPWGQDELSDRGTGSGTPGREEGAKESPDDPSPRREYFEAWSGRDPAYTIEALDHEMREHERTAIAAERSPLRDSVEAHRARRLKAEVDELEAAQENLRRTYAAAQDGRGLHPDESGAWLGDTADGEPLVDAIWRQMAEAHARDNGIQVGQARCETCGEIRKWGDPPNCDCEKRAAHSEWESDRHRRLALAKARIIPKGMVWATVDSKTWKALKAKHPAHWERLHTFATRWRRSVGSVALLGPTGIGKSAACAALLARILDTSVERREVDFQWALGVRFVDAAELIVARRNSRLGSEADMVEDAKGATLLVLDELGFEASSPVPFEVVNERYRTGLPTIITTGRAEVEFSKRYGSAFIRRIRDRGTVLDFWEKKAP